MKALAPSRSGSRLSASDTTAENRLGYRDLLVSADGMQRGISGVIMFEETLGQRTGSAETFPAFLDRIGVVPGVKVTAAWHRCTRVRWRRSPKGWTALRSGWPPIATRARVSRSGGRCCTSMESALRRDTRSMPTPSFSRATRRSANKPGSCRSSSQRFCGTETSRSARPPQ